MRHNAKMAALVALVMANTDAPNKGCKGQTEKQDCECSQPGEPSDWDCSSS